MIQRKQTLYLLLALIAMVVCTFLPIGHFEAKGMGATKVLYNLATTEEGTSLWNIVLTSLLALAATDTVLAIFQFKNRKFQANLCISIILVLLAWYCVYAVIGYAQSPKDTIFHIDFASCLPLVAIVLVALARRGILADERLVRAADRIR